MPFTDSIKMVESVIVDKDSITASPADVVNGKVYIGSTRSTEVGTMPIASAHGDVKLLAGESHNVPYGKIPLTYNVIAEPMSAQTLGTAEASDIKKDKTAWVNGEKITGTIESITAETVTLLAGQEYSIAEGYHDGTGLVKSRALEDQTYGDATSEAILDGKLAWVNGKEVEGTMPNIGSESEILKAGLSHVISKGYHDGTGVIKAQDLASQTPATATIDEIIEGKTAWVNGNQITGNIIKIPSSTRTLPINGSYTIPKGYHSGNGIITQNIPTYEGQTVAVINSAQTLSTAGHYMNGDIIVSGADALNYKRSNSAAKDPYGEEISQYELTVTDNIGVVKVYVDNWHDNATLNNYQVTFSGIDAGGTAVEFAVGMMIDWVNTSFVNEYTINGVTIKLSLEDSTNAHMFTISNITSGKISIIDAFAARTFGDSHDK